MNIIPAVVMVVVLALVFGSDVLKSVSLGSDQVCVLLYNYAVLWVCQCSHHC